MQGEHSDAHVAGIEDGNVCRGRTGAIFRAGAWIPRSAILRIRHSGTVSCHRKIGRVAGNVIVIWTLLSVFVEHDGSVSATNAGIILDRANHEVVTGIRRKSQAPNHCVRAVRRFGEDGHIVIFRLRWINLSGRRTIKLGRRGNRLASADNSGEKQKRQQAMGGKLGHAYFRQQCVGSRSEYEFF